MSESEILRVVKEAGEPLPIPKILAPFDLSALEYVAAANLVLDMAKQGRLEREDAPKGSGSGVRNLYKAPASRRLARLKGEPQ